MPDPIRDLENLSVPPVEHLPAAEVRRRGDRMRRRRTVASGALAVAAVVAAASIGVAVGALPGTDDSPGTVAATLEPTTTPTSAPEPPEPRPEAANLGPIDDSHLLDDADLTAPAGTEWSVGQTIAGGVEPSFACDGSDEGVVLASPWSPQGQVRHRVWSIEGTITLQQSIASFRTSQAAEKVVETVGQMLQDCETWFVQDWAPATRNHLVGAANQSFVVDATWRDDVEGSADAPATSRSIVSVVRVGNRVSILALDGPVGSPAFDLGSSETPDAPIDAAVEKVVERLSATP